MVIVIHLKTLLCRRRYVFSRRSLLSYLIAGAFIIYTPTLSRVLTIFAPYKTTAAAIPGKERSQPPICDQRSAYQAGFLRLPGGQRAASIRISLMRFAALF